MPPSTCQPSISSARSSFAPINGGSSSPQKGMGLSAALRIIQPAIGMQIIKAYKVQCIDLARNICQPGGLGSMRGVRPTRRSARRSQTSTNTVRPSMKCMLLISSRSGLFLGKIPLSSMQV
ncbi:hypothetical protein D9M73_233460 [compost metagenome]